MGRPKKETVVESSVVAETTPQPVVEVEKVETPDSPAKLAYMDMMIKYQKQNPVKYAGKEAGFLEKLKTL